MKISKCLSALLSLALLSTTPAALAGYTCSGPVHGVSIEAGGDVLVESVGSILWPRFCNIRATSNAIPPETCKLMYASLLVAQQSGKSVTFWVEDPATTCATFTQWQFVNGLYFLRIDG
jgi:hypothetical protein